MLAHTASQRGPTRIQHDFFAFLANSAHDRIYPEAFAVHIPMVQQV